MIIYAFYLFHKAFIILSESIILTMGQDESNDNKSCSMTGILGILIQVGLGVLSFSVLIIKRFREKPRRTWKIWIFDTSKQLISQVVAHFINLTISIALTYNDAQSDQCLWYFMTNILDNTIGVLICILCLKGIQWSLRRRNKTQFISGNYYSKERVTVEIQIMDFNKGQIKESIKIDAVSVDEKDRPLKEDKDEINQQIQQNKDKQAEAETKQQDKQSHKSYHRDTRTQQRDTQILQKYRINYQAWLVQLLIWMSIVVIGKIILFSFQYGIRNPLKYFSFLIMGWIQSYPILQLFVVIVIVPVIMNGLAFWIQDNFIMKREQNISQGQSPLVQEHTTQRQYQLES